MRNDWHSPEYNRGHQCYFHCVRNSLSGPEQWFTNCKLWDLESRVENRIPKSLFTPLSSIAFKYLEMGSY